MKEILEALTEFHRRRETFHRAYLKLAQQIGSVCRRTAGAEIGKDVLNSMTDKERKKAIKDKAAGSIQKELELFHKKKTPTSYSETFDAYSALFITRDTIKAQRTVNEKEIERIAETLPGWSWADSTPGLGALSFGQLIAESGHVCDYRKPSLLWKRFGVGFSFIPDNNGGGEFVAQNRTGNKKLAILFGRSMSRRCTLYRVGDCAAVRSKKGVYREVYEGRKAYEIERAEREGTPILPQAQASKARKTGRIVLSKLQVDLRARRFAEKRILLDLWRAFTSECSCGIRRVTA